MNRKTMPLMLMLTAGAVTCVITFIKQYSIVNKLLSLLVSLLVFYLLGSIMKWTLDLFDRQNEKRQAEEGEVIEKDPEQEAEKSESASETHTI